MKPCRIFATLGLALVPAVSANALAQEAEFTIEGTLELDNVKVGSESGVTGIEYAWINCSVCSTATCSVDATESAVVAKGEAQYPVTGLNMVVDFSVQTRAERDPATARSYACGLTVSGFQLEDVTGATSLFEERGSVPYGNVVPGPNVDFVYARTQGTPVVELKGEIKPPR